MVPESHPDTDVLASEFAGELPFPVLGKRPRVRQPTGRIYKKIVALQQTNDIVGAYDVVAWLLPDLTADEVDELTIHHVMAVCLYASGGIAAVEAMYPNVIRPAEPAPPPGSVPDSPSTT